MESVIVGIVTSALGLMLNKARKIVADGLKDGDVTYEKLRAVMIEDLHDVARKIDGLARKDLKASYLLLEEGVVELQAALDKAQKQVDKVEASCTQNDRSGVTPTTSGNMSETLNEAIALSTAIQKLETTSSHQIVSAKECFFQAHLKATEAFSNDALSLAERIMATKLRIVSKILECLQDVKPAAENCWSFLGDLNKLPGTGDAFSTYFKGGIKPKLFVPAQLENIKSVLSLNFAVSDLIAKFSGELPDLKKWPRIHLPRTVLQFLLRRRETIHPLFLDIDLVKEIFEQQEFQPPENQVISKDQINLKCCCINSKSQLLYNCGNSIRILCRSGETKTFCLLRRATANRKGNDQKVEELAVDRDDNVYVIICFSDRSIRRYVCVLFVFYPNGREKYQRVLDFLEKDEYGGFSYDCETVYVKSNGDVVERFETREFNCVVNNDGDILFYLSGRDYICVCSSDGNIKARLSPVISSDYVNSSLEYVHLQCVTEQNDIVMRSTKTVFILTKEGKLKRMIRDAAAADREPVFGTHPERQFVEQIVYNYTSSKIDVPVSNSQTGKMSDQCTIVSYSEDAYDVCECLYLPCRSNCYLWLGRLCSHPTGPSVLINQRTFKSSGESKVVFM